MHEKMSLALRCLSRPCAVQLASELNTKSVIGYETAKKNTLFATALEFKTFSPQHIVIIRVGETYEAFGVDAALILECNPSMERSKAGDTRVVFHTTRIQTVINELLRHKHTVAVYEESEVLCTPRHRYLAQIVTAASPTYALGIETDSTPLPQKIAAVLSHESGRVTVCLLDVTQRLCQRLTDVEVSHAMPLVKSAMRPIYVMRRRPEWLDESETVLLGVDANCDVAQRLLMTISIELKIKPDEFTTVSATPSRCAPLSGFTMQQLGLLGEMGVPSLVNYCLPRGACMPLRQQIRDWLIAPPSEASAKANREVMLQLRACTTPMPVFEVTMPGRRQRAVQGVTLDAQGLRSLRTNVRGLLDSPIDIKTLLESVCRDRGCIQVTVEALRRVLETIDASLTDATVNGRDARGCAYRIHTQNIAAPQLDFERADCALRAVLAAWDEDEIVRDARGVALRGRPDKVEKLIVYDKANRQVSNQYTTRSLQTAEDAVAHALRVMLDADAAAVKACTRSLHELLPEVGVIESASLRLATLIEHARLVVCKSWNATDEGHSVDLKGLVPYWMDAASTVLNRVTFHHGAIAVLTAPNGGGKTTMLRATAACLLLHQCGLHAPCGPGSACPALDHLFLRAGALDCVLERRSSFSSEMHDLLAVLQARGNVVALIDEPCSGTSTAEALSLLRSIMSHMPSDTTFVLSTHHHEVEAPDDSRVVRLQMGADVVGDDCRPTYSLKAGTCTDSLALQVALAVGLPLEIVRDARRSDDVETLILLQLRLHRVKFEKMTEGQTPPPSFHSTLYIVDTTHGVYVGETDRIAQRLRTHATSKPEIRCFYVASCDNKTTARTLETAMINELRFHNVQLLSDADGAHGV